MKTFQVSFYKIYPGCTKEEDDVLTAFVLANSFQEVVRKVEQRYAHEYEQAEVFAICVAKKAEIII